MEPRKKASKAKLSRRITDRQSLRSSNGSGQIFWTFLVALLFGVSVIQHAVYPKRVAVMDKGLSGESPLRVPASQ